MKFELKRYDAAGLAESMEIESHADEGVYEFLHACFDGYHTKLELNGTSWKSGYDMDPANNNPIWHMLDGDGRPRHAMYWAFSGTDMDEIKDVLACNLRDFIQSDISKAVG